MSYLSVTVPVLIERTMEYRLILSDTEPTPADGYLIYPTPIEIAGMQGKLWLEYKIF